MDISEVQLLLSAPQASGGYLSPGSVYNSLGQWASTTQVNAGVPLNNLFPDLTGPQNAAGQVDYQCVFVFNTDPAVTLVDVTAWIPASSVTGAVQWAVGADAVNPSLHNAALAPQAGYITSPTLAPSTVTRWAGPSPTVAGGVPVSQVGPGKVAALWVRRTATGSPAFAGASFTLQVTFDVIGAGPSGTGVNIDGGSAVTASFPTGDPVDGGTAVTGSFPTGDIDGGNAAG